MFRRGLVHRVAATIEHSEIPFSEDFATVIDVGAHRGQFALFALDHFPRASLYCFEPLPASYATLQQITARYPRARAFECALGRERGSSELHVSRLSDSSSLLPIAPRYTAAFPGTDEVATAWASVERLDDVIEVESLTLPCLVKLDVQGGELDALRGAVGTLSRTSELLVECSFIEFYRGQALASEVISFLHRAAFDLVGVFGLKRDRAGRCLQADMLFRRR